MDASAFRPLSDTSENCLGEMPSTTDVLGLKLAEAVRRREAVKSWVLVASVSSSVR
jgi:hypothetical protein